MMMVKDELDVLPHTLGWLSTQVDGIVIADNGSTDGTREWLRNADLGLELHVQDDEQVGYWQSVKMSFLAAWAAHRGATWIVPVDADEAWYSPHGRIADVLAQVAPGIAVARALLYDHVATGLDPELASPLERMGWRRREPGGLPKIAARPSLPLTIEQGNHGARYADAGVIDDLLVVRHFPYRSGEQMTRKARNGAAAYAATDLPETAGAHWRQYGRLLEVNPEAMHEVFAEWFHYPDPEGDPTLIFDPAPCP